MPLYTFLNGTQAQKDRWREGPAHMMNLPVLSLPVSVEVEFLPPEELQAQTTLAETFFTYGDAGSKCKVRNDYPAFGGGDGKLESLEAEAAAMGLDYSTALHSQETPVHELGHSMFGALDEATRLKVCALFGADTDDLDVINNEDLIWQDRVIEAIAETFKECFLPARYRVFPNRTNLHIGYKDYPQFRRFFRGAAGEATNEFCYLYGGDDFRQPELEARGIDIPVHLSDRDPEAFVEYTEAVGFPKGWGVQMEQFEEAGKLPFSISTKGIDA